MDWLDSLINDEEFAANTRKIKRVPEILRQTHPNASCYDSSFIRIGPKYYHLRLAYSAPEDKSSAPDAKISAGDNYKESVRKHYASKVIKSGLSFEQVYERVKELLLRARNCYGEGLFYKNNHEEDDEYWIGRRMLVDRSFSERMFTDGLFLVEFIYSEVTGSSTIVRMSKGDRDLVCRDILLMENQIPFHILQLFAAFMYDMTADQSLRMIKRFLSQLIASPFRRRTRDHRFPKYFSLFCGRHESTAKSKSNSTTPIHLLDLLRASHFVSTDHCIVIRHEETDVLAFPSATQLKKVGINCVACATSDKLSDFHFRSYMLSGELVLPLLTIDIWTKPLFLNLLALCISEDEDDQRGSVLISSYLWIMYNLIDQVEDVKELQSRGILQNRLDSDQEVVDLFREIALEVVPDPHPFMHVRRQISEYLTSTRFPLRVVFAEFKNRYFNSPWSILVFLAIIFTVSLTIIQTVLAGIQTYLAAYPPTKK